MKILILLISLIGSFSLQASEIRIKISGDGVITSIKEIGLTKKGKEYVKTEWILNVEFAPKMYSLNVEETDEEGDISPTWSLSVANPAMMKTILSTYLANKNSTKKEIFEKLEKSTAN